MGRVAPEQSVPNLRVRQRARQNAEVVNQEERIDNDQDNREPDALRLPANESFPKREDAADPEKLGGNQRHEAYGEDQEDQEEIQRLRPLVPIGDDEETAKNNPQEK